MKLIETKTLVLAAASIEFTSIPQTFTDLVFICSLRNNAAVPADFVNIRFNSVTTGYSSRIMQGNGAGVSTQTVTETLLGVNGNSTTANTFANGTVYIPNYAGNTNKSFSADGVTENNATTANQFLGAHLFSNTAAITSVEFLAASILAGSTISLYGITKGSSGGVVVS